MPNPLEIINAAYGANNMQTQIEAAGGATMGHDGNFDRTAHSVAGVGSDPEAIFAAEMHI